MDEEIRFRREVVFRVLGWGTVVYFLVIGFALNQHGLFELNPAEGSDRLHRAQVVHAETLDRKNDELREKDPVEAAKLGVDAAKIRVEVDQARKDQSDNRFRAVGLVLVVLMYSVGYPLVIWFVYRRTDSGGAAAERDAIPLRVALVYGITMSLLTLASALATSYQ